MGIGIDIVYTKANSYSRFFKGKFEHPFQSTPAVAGAQQRNGASDPAGGLRAAGEVAVRTDHHQPHRRRGRCVDWRALSLLLRETRDFRRDRLARPGELSRGTRSAANGEEADFRPQEPAGDRKSTRL